MVFAKVVRKYIAVWLLCHKSTQYYDILRGAFSLNKTRETRIDESAPVGERVHEKCERNLKEISSLVDLYFTNRKGRSYPPTESCINCSKLSHALWKKAVPVYIAVSDEKKLQTWADS